jgi:N-acyl homoserine lactone hydrolase
MVPRVYLIKPGSMMKNDSGRILDARSSVTLISAGPRKIIVDTGLKGEEEIILNSLAQREVMAEDVDTIVNTHAHPDHIGNNHLFSRAKLLAPTKEELIAPSVKSIETPGHSMDSISIVVESYGVVVLAGDALPTLNNYLKDTPPARHVDRDLAYSSMSRILKIADVVVPGHDRPFSVSNRTYLNL